MKKQVFILYLLMGIRDKNMVTMGQRRLGKKIRKLENSVELSSKEGKAKLAEQKYKQEKLRIRIKRKCTDTHDTKRNNHI